MDTIAKHCTMLLLGLLYTGCQCNKLGFYDYDLEEFNDTSICQDSVLEDIIVIEDGEESTLPHTPIHMGKTRYKYDGHPGTKPDDEMYGFDPWDDEDDAYNVERNQQDPYPNEW